jgi:hypothetical protein
MTMKLLEILSSIDVLTRLYSCMKGEECNLSLESSIDAIHSLNPVEFISFSNHQKLSEPYTGNCVLQSLGCFMNRQAFFLTSLCEDRTVWNKEYPLDFPG